VAPINPHSPAPKDQELWNEAYDRLWNYLHTFGLGDHAYRSQLALDVFQRARELHREDPSRAPATYIMEQTQKRLADWLATNLGEADAAPSHLLVNGTIALLLSRVYRTAPTSFLANPLPEELRHALRETLLVTGPDLTISSMTPRHLDYGPMLQIARQTWHRWEAKEVVIALLFWAGVYTVFYWWLSPVL